MVNFSYYHHDLPSGIHMPQEGIQYASHFRDQSH